MKKCLISFLATALVAGTAVADQPAVTNMAERIRMAKYRAFGGTVRKSGSAKGAVAFLNAQKRVPAAEIRRAVGVIDDVVHVVCKYEESAKVDAGNPKPEFVRMGCAVGVAVVDDAKLPALLVAPEDGWAVVNVAPLAEKSDAATLAARTRKEVLRAFVLAGGGCFMSRAPLVMVETARPVELDDIRYEELGADALNQLAKTLPARGVVPWHQTTYRRACQEGWASSPTNDVQKKIWDKVKAEADAKPSNPMKITKEKK